MSRNMLLKRGFRCPTESPNLQLKFSRLTVAPFFPFGSIGQNPESLGRNAPWELAIGSQVSLIDYGIHNMNAWSNQIIPYRKLERDNSIMLKNRVQDNLETKPIDIPVDQR